MTSIEHHEENIDKMSSRNNGKYGQKLIYKKSLLVLLGNWIISFQTAAKLVNTVGIITNICISPTFCSFVIESLAVIHFSHQSSAYSVN